MAHTRRDVHCDFSFQLKQPGLRGLRQPCWHHRIGATMQQMNFRF